MNCDCIEKITNKMKENGYPEARIKNQGFIFSTGEMTLNTVWEYQEMKKDGTPKKSKSNINIIMSNCPFCGISTKKDVQEKTNG